MWYVYDKRSSAVVKSYKTHPAAQAAITRAHKKYVRAFPYVPGSNAHEDDPLFWMAAADSQYYHMFIEQRKIVRNLMSGKEVEISVNTPRSCDPSSELYWSM
jgi:hypothetical protein